MTEETNLAVKTTTDLSNPYSSMDAFEDAQRVANMLSKSDFIPNTFKNNIPNCLIAMNMSNRMGSDPLMVMQNLFTVYGKPSFSSSFLIALVNNSKDFKGRLNFVYSEDRQSCYAMAIDAVTGEQLIGTEVSIEMAKKEGWYNRKSDGGGPASKWPSMPEQMLAYRAATFWVRLYAPDLAMGMATQDEIQDIGATQGAVDDGAPTAAELLNVQSQIDLEGGDEVVTPPAEKPEAKPAKAPKNEPAVIATFRKSVEDARSGDELTEILESKEFAKLTEANQAIVSEIIKVRWQLITST